MPDREPESTEAPSGAGPGSKASQPPNASFLQVAGAVFSSFFGVRKGNAMSRDIGSIKPLHVIIAAVVFVALFVSVLIVVVRLITR